MKIACLVPPIHMLVNEIGHGYHPPLGLLAIAGPLVDAGFEVKLIDADAGHLSQEDVVRQLQLLGSRLVLVGHSGSMVANPAALNLIEGIKTAIPDLVIVYGGVYPTYAYREIMAQAPAIDFIIRGEGEVAVLALLLKLASQTEDFETIAGLVWRSNGEIVANPLREPIQDLDDFRVAWELADWALYEGHHLPGRSAIVRFSRGCPYRCTYCGQWMFWKQWRHRGIDAFVDEMEYLREQYDVRTIWIADENWGVDRKLFMSLLETIIIRRINMSIFCAMRAEDIVRDADKMQLYQAAGIVCLMLGVESLESAVLKRIGKNNPYEITAQAVKLLRDHNILSVVNVIYGLQSESWGTLWQMLRKLRSISPDFYNALHLTPLSWTAEGSAIDSAQIIQLDQRKWDFRQPVIQPEYFSPRGLAMAVKISEALFYSRPIWFMKRYFSRDPVIRRIIRGAFPRLGLIYFNEWLETLQTSFVSPGQALNEIDRLSLLLPMKTFSQLMLPQYSDENQSEHGENSREAAA